MEIKFSEEMEIDGKTIYSLFKSAGWILPRSEKPTSHQKNDGISNHTIYLDSEEECEILEKAFKILTQYLSPNLKNGSLDLFA